MMRRLSLLLALAAIVTMIMIVSVMPAAAKRGESSGGSGEEHSGGKGRGGARVIHQDQGTITFNKHGGPQCNHCTQVGGD